MFIGRKDELKQLENIYANEHSNVLVIYGRAGIGKTTLALKFCEKKHYIYYKAGDVSEDEQIKGIEKAVIEKMHEPSDAKTVLVIDEFRFAATPELKSGLMKLIKEEQTYGRYMVLLLSSSVNWIENSMVAENKDFARFITGIFKIKELSFAETVEWFPKSTASDCVMIRAILGGVPRYLKLWQENRRIRENLLSLFFSPDAPLLNERHLRVHRLRPREDQRLPEEPVRDGYRREGLFRKRSQRREYKEGRIQDQGQLP